MAIANKIDPETVGQPLGEAIAEGLGVSAVEVDDVQVPPSAGMSNETLLFGARWDGEGRELVARVQPQEGGGIFMTYDVERERRLLGALRAEGTIPVPEVLFAEGGSRI